VYLTVTGSLPSAQASASFLDDENPKKRERLVSRLLNSELGCKYMQMRWGDILRIKSEFPSNLWPNGVQAYNRWIYEQLMNNVPYDQMVRNLLLCEGSNFRSPAVNFYRAFQQRTPENFYKNINLLFLGNRYCTDNGFYCFSQVQFKSTKEWKEEIIYLDIHKERPWQTITLTDGTKLAPKQNTDWREVYVAWLTSPKNRRFAEVLVNRMWYWVFGKGIVHEPDDWREENKPSDPALLKELTDYFLKNNFDMKLLWKKILLSEQFNSKAAPEGYYVPQRLPAEVIVDALASVTNIWSTYSSRVPEPFTFYPPRTRATHLGDATVSSSELELFGKVSRDVSLESQRNNSITSRQLLYLMNSSVLERRIRKSQILQQIYFQGGDVAQVADGITLRVLSRRATPQEVELYKKHMEESKLPLMEVAIDIMWMQLNSNEFLYNH
jgi:endonuclease YncB( thermonuclease family)